MNTINVVNNSNFSFTGYKNINSAIKKGSKRGRASSTYYGPLGCGLFSSIVFPKEKEETPPTPIELAKADNPELFNALISKTHKYTYTSSYYNIEESTTRNYSDTAIITLIKYNKEDSDFAYKLSKYLEHTDNSQLNRFNEPTIEQTELIAQTLKTEPELLEKIQYPTPKSTALILEYRAQSPDFFNLLLKHNSLDSMIDWEQNVQYKIKTFEQNKEIITDGMENLTGNFDEMLRMLSSYREDKDKTKELCQLFKENFKRIPNHFPQFFEYYKKYPEATANTIRNPRIRNNEFRQAVDRMGPIIIAEGMAMESKLEPILAKIENLSKDRRYSIIKYFASCPEVLDRIVEDRRADKAIELKELYLQNPDKPVTDKMVKKFLDPISKFFN